MAQRYGANLTRNRRQPYFYLTFQPIIAEPYLFYITLPQIDRLKE